MRSYEYPIPSDDDIRVMVIKETQHYAPDLKLMEI